MQHAGPVSALRHDQAPALTPDTREHRRPTLATGRGDGVTHVGRRHDAPITHPVDDVAGAKALFGCVGARRDAVDHHPASRGWEPVLGPGGLIERAQRQAEAGGKDMPHLEKTAHAMFDDLGWWARVLKQAREADSATARAA